MKKLIVLFGLILIGGIANAGYVLNPITGRLDFTSASTGFAIYPATSPIQSPYYASFNGVSPFTAAGHFHARELVTPFASTNDLLRADAVISSGYYFQNILSVYSGTTEGSVTKVGGMRWFNNIATQELQLIDASGNITHTYGVAGAIGPYTRIGNTGTTQNNTLNIQGSFGLSAVDVVGSTTISVNSNYWLYRVDTTTGPVGVTFSYSLPTLPHGRLSRVCKVDNTVNAVQLPDFNVTLTNINSCADVFAEFHSGGSSVDLRFLGIVSSTNPVTVSGDSFGTHIATKDVQGQGFGLFNFSTVTFRCLLVGNTTAYWDDIPLKSDSKFYLFQIHSGTITAVEAVADGVRTGGVAGSTTTFKSRVDLNETTLNTGAAPTTTASNAGEIFYDTTDNMAGLTDGATTYGIAAATETFSVLLSSVTGNGTGGWDSMTWTFITPATYPIYIRSVYAAAISGTSVILNVDSRQASFGTDTGGTNIFKSSQTITTTLTKVIDLQNQLIAPGSAVVFKTPPSASSGSVGRLTIGLNYSKVIR